MKPQTHSKINPGQLLKWALAIALFVLIVGYSSWQLRHILSGPTLIITSPAAGFVGTDPAVEVTGRAEDIDWLYLNGRQIFTDEAGEFSEEIVAEPGYNVIQLAGKDKFGRQTTKMVEFVINSQQQKI